MLDSFPMCLPSKHCPRICTHPCDSTILAVSPSANTVRLGETIPADMLLPVCCFVAVPVVGAEKQQVSGFGMYWAISLQRIDIVVRNIRASVTFQQCSWQTCLLAQGFTWSQGLPVHGHYHSGPMQLAHAASTLTFHADANTTLITVSPGAE
jgi:hypothetical protein